MSSHTGGSPECHTPLRTVALEHGSRTGSCQAGTPMHQSTDPPFWLGSKIQSTTPQLETLTAGNSKCSFGSGWWTPTIPEYVWPPTAVESVPTTELHSGLSYPD